MVSTCEAVSGGDAGPGADVRVTHRAVNACLAPVYSVAGMHVVTVEGVSLGRGKLHPVQQKLADAHGQQCGFCTPGFVMAMYALLRSKDSGGAITEDDIEEAISGNLCRCTGYRPILDAFRSFAKTDDAAYHVQQHTDKMESRKHGNGNGIGNGNGNGIANGNGNGVHSASVKTCPSTGLPCACGENTETKASANGNGKSHTNGESLTPACENGNGSCNGNGTKAAHKEVIFPPSLKRAGVAVPSLSMQYKADATQSWYRPTSLSELLELVQRVPDARIVVGSTEVTIENRMRGMPKGGLISTTHVPELLRLNVDVAASRVHIGASVTLSRLQKEMRDIGEHMVATREFGAVCRAIERQLRWFAGVQIRNVASVGGNVCTASPISDLNPLWIAAGCMMKAASADGGARDIPASEFFVGYRKTALRAHEVLVGLELPLTRPLEFFREFKQSHRREDDIAIVNAGLRARFEKTEDGAYVCRDASFCFGGVGATPVCAVKAQHCVLDAKWGTDPDIVGNTIDALMEDIVLGDTSPGGMPEFRRSLAASFFFKFYTYVCGELAALDPEFTPSSLAQGDLDAGRLVTEAPPPVHGMQVYDTAAEKVAAAMSSGAAIKHRAADQQVSGEAVYGDDIELPPSAGHGALVLTTKPHARILSIDASEALAYKGVRGFFTAADVPGCNNAGPVVKDEPLFVTDEVLSTGLYVGIVVADTHLQAKEAARLVKVEYEELPAILGIRDAIAASSFLTSQRELERGDVDAEYERLRDDSAYARVSGEITLGGQEHFYLEPNNVTVYPGENSEMISVSSTQAPAKHQKVVASVLGIPMNKVICKTKRIGGGFGGKETRAIIINAAAAVAAWHLGTPVRLLLDRDEDMATTGHRHPFLGRYSAVYSSDGKIAAAEIQMYSNGGYSQDLSEPVMERALFHADNCYSIPNLRIRGVVCRTNMPSNTAFRGFGGPQGMMIAEALIDDVARSAGLSPETVRAANMYREGEMTHFGMRLESFKVPDCYAACVSDLSARRARIDEFNRANTWRKRGLAAVPTKFGISFTATFMNQAGALIHVYTDGTVLVTHGGVEMGQGLHTKIAQIVATELDISVTDVYIADTSTDKVPNASPTAASASTDLYGAAAQDACRQLRERLRPYREACKGSFKDAANAAYMDRVDLSAHGFYITPGVSWDWVEKRGRPFNYFTVGAAISEVELDVLTGDCRALRSDVVMDVGLPVNPAIDVGQIEGGFIQGLGWCVLEELKWGDAAHPWARPGHLITRGPGAYKIPTADDIPRELNVTLLRNAPNPRAVHSSKAVGEPPFFLASSVFFAAKDAVYATRPADARELVSLDLPATPERLRMACGDSLIDKVRQNDDTTAPIPSVRLSA